MQQSRRPLALACSLALELLVLSAAPALAAPSPDPLTAQPSAQDFGVVNVDRGEQSTTIQIQNPGPDGAQVGGATLDGPRADVYRIDYDGCNGQLLAPGNTCNVQVGFDPSDEGDATATLHVPADVGDVAVPLSGVGGVQRVASIPDTLDFGSLEVGDAATRTVTIANTGNLPWQAIVALPASGDVGAFRIVRDSCAMQVLQPAGSCALDVRFAPASAATVQATLMVINGEGPPALVALRGSGRQPATVIAPGSADFGEQAVGSASDARTLAVVNAGSGTLRIPAVGIGGEDADQFRVAGESCTAALLPPAASCAVRVRFAPGVAGDAAAVLRLATNDDAGVVSAPLAGTGTIAPPPAVLRAGVAFSWGDGLPAPFAAGRIDLGIARCAPAVVRCAVHVSARVYAIRAGGGTTSARGRAVVWHPGSGTHASLTLPRKLRGTPALLVARLRTSAAGRRGSRRTLVVPLVRGRRVGPRVLAHDGRTFTAR
jgi:hypothetical protein